MLTRRDFGKLASIAPLAAMSQPVPTPIYEQYIPLMTLPVDAPAGLGLGAPWQSGDNVPAMLERLRPAWWYDWRFEQCGAPGYVPMIWSTSVWSRYADVLASLFTRRPELFWLLWNEPERADQANMPPDICAEATRLIAAHGIQYAAPGVSLTRSGYEWLEAYMAAGGPVPHVWHVHIYRCLTPGQWSAAWAAWVDWMHLHNVVRPTIVSETNGWTEGDYGQRAILDHVAAMLADDDLFQAVAWFATRWDAWGAGTPDLLRDDGSLTPVGDTFAALREHPDYQREFARQIDSTLQHRRIERRSAESLAQCRDVPVRNR